MTAPPASLAVLLLVFVLVQTYASWAAAGRAETDEATATLLLFREADLVRDARLRATLHKQVVCYATSVIRLAILGTATLASVGRSVHVVIVVAAAVVFTSALILVRDLDQRYAGSVRREPTQTEFIRGPMAAELRGPLPCDAEGLPVGVPGLRARTSPLG
jgi:hypothetical protein